MEDLQESLLAAIEEAPASMRALAREAGIPHSTLVRIRQGRLGVTPAVARAVADALQEWSTVCTEGSDGLKRALSQVE